MEPGYLQIDWDTIPRLYKCKHHLLTLVIEKKEWDRLSDPAQLAHFWEPTQNAEDFHGTLALALCWTPFHDSPDAQRKGECIMYARLLENRPGTTGFPLWQLQKNSRTVPTKQPILYYWSGFIGNLYCSWIFTMIDTDTTLPLCKIPVKGIMWGIRRYSLEHNYIMLTPPGKGHLLKQSSCRHSWIGQRGTL